MNFQELISGLSGCSPSAHSDYFDNTGSMNGFEDVSRDHFPSRSPELDGMETGSALPAAANSAVAAAPQPTLTPIPIAQVSQPPVSKRDIIILQMRIEELALRVASIYSEPWKDFVIKQDILDSFDDLEEKKDILEDKIAGLEEILHAKTAPPPPRRRTPPPRRRRPRCRKRPPCRRSRKHQKVQAVIQSMQRECSMWPLCSRIMGRMHTWR